MTTSRIVTAITGASGVIYGCRFTARAAALGLNIDLVVSNSAQRVAMEEMGARLDIEEGPLSDALAEYRDRVRIIPVNDIGAEAASGSAEYVGMAIIPCSMGTLGRIASGVSSNLIERAADVSLKERRPLVVVPRESPFHLIHLKNMTLLTEAGAIVLPAMPSFYTRPNTTIELIDTVVDRALSFFVGQKAIQKPWNPGEQGADS